MIGVQLSMLCVFYAIRIKYVSTDLGGLFDKNDNPIKPIQTNEILWINIC